MVEKPDAPEEEQVALSKAEYQELIEKIASSTQDKANLVNEIKELREKKQLTEAETESLKQKVAALSEANGGANPPEEIIEETVNRVLSKKDEEEVRKSLERAKKSFLMTHKELHPENDEGGIKLSAFERTMSRFNLQGLRTEQEFQSLLEDAYDWMNKGKATPSEKPAVPYSSTPSSPGYSKPPVVDDTNLSPKELKLIEQTFGGDKERFLRQKAKRPDYVETLLQYVR